MLWVMLPCPKLLQDLCACPMMPAYIKTNWLPVFKELVAIEFMQVDTIGKPE